MEQRAKLFWLKEGDENTKVFHANATAGRKANRVQFLLKEDGTRVDTDKGISELIFEYFSQVFAAHEESGARGKRSSPMSIT